jgi:hypothetical protein
MALDLIAVAFLPYLLDSTLHFEALAEKETQRAAREVFLATARAFRRLAITDGRRFAREMPKRTAEASVRRMVKRKRA